MAISIVTSNAGNNASVQNRGYTQGVPQDTFARMQDELRSGVISSAETLPMWGGIAVNIVNAASPSSRFGNTLKRATAASEILGFTTFYKGINLRQTTDSPVPMSAIGSGTINYFELGSRMLLPIAVDATLAATLASDQIDLTDHEVELNFTTMTIIPIASGVSLATLGLKIIDLSIGNCNTVSWSSPNATWNKTGSCALVRL